MLEFFFGRLLTSLMGSQLFWKVVAVWVLYFTLRLSWNKEVIKQGLVGLFELLRRLLDL